MQLSLHACFAAPFLFLQVSSHLFLHLVFASAADEQSACDTDSSSESALCGAASSLAEHDTTEATKQSTGTSEEIFMGALSIGVAHVSYLYCLGAVNTSTYKSAFVSLVGDV
jgi:hypothetical protein